MNLNEAEVFEFVPTFPFRMTNGNTWMRFVAVFRFFPAFYPCIPAADPV